MRRDGWVALLLLIWVAGGIAALIRSEIPRGRVVGKVVAAETGQPLSGAEIWFESGEGSYRTVSKKDGSFALTNLPAMTYTVTASTYAHHLERTQFTLNEGEQRNLLIALEPVSPFLELVHPQTVFRPDEPVKIGVRGFVNTDELRLQVWRVRWNERSKTPLSVVLNFLNRVREGWWYGQWELRDEMRTIASALEPIGETHAAITQRDAEGVFFQFVPVNLLADGIYLVHISTENLERIALVERTPVGIVVKVGRDKRDVPVAIIYAADLKTGKPVEGIAVTALARQRIAGRIRDRILANGSTNADGLAQLPLPEQPLGDAENLFVTAHRNGNIFAWISLDEWEMNEAAEVIPKLVGTIYTDRPVYRPGNVVHFKGIVREQIAGTYLPAALWSSIRYPPVSITVRDPDGNTFHRTELPLRDFSSFSGTLTLSDEAPTGTYTIEAELANERVTGSFVVAAYRKPEVQVVVKPTRRRFTRTETATVEVTARYYFGMPVANAKVRYWVNRMPVVDEWEVTEWGEEYGGEGVMSGETQTDGLGRAAIRFRPDDLPAETPPFSEFRYEVSATVEAKGYQFAEATGSFLITQGDWRVRLWCEPSFCYAGETVTAKAKVTHWDTKKPQGNATVLWRAGVMEWRGRKTDVRWLWNGESLTDAGGVAVWKFAPTQIGDWVIEATVRDERKNAIGAQTNLWVAPKKPGEPQPPQAPPLQLWMDKETYRLGETACIGVRSKIADATVLLTVEGDRLHDVRLLRLRDGVAEWRLPVTNAFLPNAYVSACLVWNKKFAKQTKPMRIALEGKRLKVSVNTDKSQYEPRQPAQITVQVRDANGKPVKAELSLAVVDEAIYAIQEDDPEQVFRAFYAERRNRIVTRYSFPWLAWQGDKGEAETVRRYFPDTALWLPHLVTDRNGVATVTMTVPDTLTQWRITAIAHTLDTSVGYGIHRFRCTKPFGVRIAMPMVLTQNDVTTISAIVHNDTERPCNATLSWRIAHERGNAVTDAQSVSIPASKTTTVQRQFVAEQAGKWTITVRAKSDDGKRDAEERTVIVLPHATERLVAKTAWLGRDETETVTRIALPSNADLQNSRINVRIAPSVFSVLLGALEYLAHYPYGCVEQTMDSFLPDLLVWQVLKERGIKAAWLERELPKMVQKGLTRLYRFQHDDGGWGWWEDDPTDVWMTALVVRGLAEAKRVGFNVSDRVLTRGKRALRRHLRERWHELNADTIAFALFALARAGEPMPQWRQPQFLPAAIPQSPIVHPLRRLFAQCSPYGLAFLCLALQEWRHPEMPKATDFLLRKAFPLGERLQWVITEHHAHHEWTTDDEATAWALLALLRTGAIDAQQAGSTVLALLTRRKGDGWVSTKDTAAILEALLEFAKRFERTAPSVPMSVTLSLNGAQQTIALPPESGWQPEQTVRLQNALRHGANELRIVKAKGIPLWATVIVRQILALPEWTGELLMGGHILQRRYEKLMPPQTGEGGRMEWRGKPLQVGDAVKVGELVRVTLTVDCSDDFMVLEDPLPAGFRVVTKEQREGEEVWGGTPPKEVRDDKTVTFFRHRGRYMVRYLLRAEVPGDYHILPPRLWQMYGTGRVIGTEERLRVIP